ncbi:MAG: SusC/RagA family TonB-linked outer membrane protein [Longimicrobiaceae bacterium]
MRHIHWLLAIALAAALVPAGAMAQERGTIQGTVVEAATQRPLAGAQVTVSGTQLGTLSNAQGRFQIVNVPTGQHMVRAQMLGYGTAQGTVTVETGAVATVSLVLEQTAVNLEGLVVTALGIERERSQLGTAQQQISTEDLNAARAPSVVNQMQGKVSGVQITGGGTPGGSNNIVIRGSNSIAGNNQPLFIVDGIPVSNNNRAAGTNHGRGLLISGFDYGNAISDLNPEDIATVTVLKGPNAAAIYGSRAANGAVVITTKKGAAAGGGIRTEFSTSITTERPSILPDFQNQYGQGSAGTYFITSDQSWGPRMEGQLLCQYNSPGFQIVGAPNYPCATPTPFSPQPNNVRDFFDAGVTTQTTLAVSGGSERANARLSLGYDNVDGYIPNNSFEKYTALLNGAITLNDRTNVTGNVQYIRNDGVNRPGTGYNQSILQQFFWFGRQVNINDLRNYQQARPDAHGNREFNWNYNYHNNPFWIQHENRVQDSRDRIVAQGTLNYELLPGVSALLRTGSDIYTLRIEQRYAPNYLGFTNPAFAGGFVFIDDYSNDNNTDLLLTVNRSLTPNLSLNALAGGGLRREYYQTKSQSTNGLTVPGLYNLSNAAVTPSLAQNVQERHVNSVLGSASLTWNDWFTLEGTARNDWSSTLPAGENSYFYPSISASVVLTDAIPALQANPVVSFLKIRGSVAEVGNDAAPYQLRTTFTGLAQQFNGRAQFTQGDVLANANLKPELTRSTEFGAEVELLGGRVVIDGSVYDKETRNQIFPVPISPASGFTSQSINAGLVTNKGVEALVSVTPVQMPRFRWTTTLNWAQNRSNVAELFPGVETVVLGSGLFGEAQLQARVDRPLGAIFGAIWERDEQGRLLTEDGLPFTTGALEYLGSIQPDWTGGWQNEFSYGPVQLSVLFDMKRGGSLMSYTNLVGNYSGVLTSSLRGREVAFDNPGILVEGIDVNTGQPNTIRLESEEYFQGIFGVAEPYVYDASYVKLRELRFGFDLPARWTRAINTQNVNVAITGRNLVTWTDVPNIDPEFAYSSGNFQGIEYAIPSNPRSVGFSVRVRP